LMQWYYSKNHTQLGPLEQAELAAKIASGEVAITDLVWRDGMLDWVPAGQVPELRPPPGTPAARSPLLGQASGSPYAPPGAVPEGGELSTYLWQSIVVTLLCCQPFGIPAIVYAAKANAFKECGDLERARTAADSARTWCWVSFGIGLVVQLLVLVSFAGTLVA
ncbi:MAG: hypothetical protein RLZZ522_167, partial [Verrucomicrobiota bacterium]